MSKKVKIYPHLLSGNLTIMPSKSLSHRAVICATLAGNSIVKNVGLSRDIKCTIQAMKDLGHSNGYVRGNTFFSNEKTSDYVDANELLPELTSQLFPQENREHYKKIATETFENLDANNLSIFKRRAREVYCEESGSTLRMLIPQALDGIPTFFFGAPRLMERSMIVYEELFELHGITMKRKSDRIFVQGSLSHGLFSMRGDVSSQFISGLLLALPACRGDSVLSLTTEVESKAYIDLTIDMMQRFGVDVEWVNEQTIHVAGNNAFKPNEVTIEGDYSHAAFWIVGGVLGEGIRLSGLNDKSLQGDRAVIDIMRKMGADIEQTETECFAKTSKLKGTTVDISQTPDLFPVLAAAAVFAEGKTLFANGLRLRDKECDRLAAMAIELARLGVQVEETKGSLTVYGIGNKNLTGNVTCEGYNDHRIVMALSILASRCTKPIVITDAMSVEKSAPDFWEEYAQVGGNSKFKL